jgi:4-diphosphocytidyl-2-C-methyl-D-erythritol kinase
MNGRMLLAPAKLTLSILVTGVRADGYHELDAEMVTLSLADELVLEDGGSGLQVDPADDVGRGVRALGDPAQNLVVRALQAVQRQAAVRLTKHIPVGAGLGGGSADAAAVLRWAGCRDLALAARLGSDVPFCLVGGRARVSGAGEVVAPLPHRDREFLLLLAPFGVSTAAVYRAWDDALSPSGGGPNELAPSALAVEPRLARWRDALGDLTGAEPVLAGSGSTWFVEVGGVGDITTELPSELVVDGERGRMVRARAVPAGWKGD